MTLYEARAKAKPMLPKTASENFEELRYTIDGKNLQERGGSGGGARTTCVIWCASATRCPWRGTTHCSRVLKACHTTAAALRKLSAT
jgi:hypothetical protein